MIYQFYQCIEAGSWSDYNYNFFSRVCGDTIIECSPSFLTNCIFKKKHPSVDRGHRTTDQMFGYWTTIFRHCSDNCEYGTIKCQCIPGQHLIRCDWERHGMPTHRRGQSHTHSHTTDNVEMPIRMPTAHVFGLGEEAVGNAWPTGRTCKLHIYTVQNLTPNPGGTRQTC